MQIVVMPLQGLAQGAQPIISYNYGAKQMDRVKKTFKLTLISCLSFTVIMCSLLMLFPNLFVSIFNNEPELVAITTWAIRIYFLGTNSLSTNILSLRASKDIFILSFIKKGSFISSFNIYTTKLIPR